MGNFVFQNQKVFLAHYNLTANVNAIALSATRDTLDDTTLGSNTKSNFPGLMNVTFNIEGLYEGSTQGDVGLSSQIGIQGRPFTIVQSSSSGSQAYFLNAMQADYTPFNNSVGELAGFSAGGVTAKGSSAPANLINGFVTYWTENFTTSITSTSGTAMQLGAVSSQQRIYGAVHVFSTPTSQHSVTPTLYSASASNASSSQWTARLSFSAYTTAGSSFMSAPGAITDTWWMVQHATVSSSQSTGIYMAVVAGIY